jgi:hypothetical protein
MSTPDPFALARALLRQNQEMSKQNHEMSKLLESLIPEPDVAVGFIPNSNQELILRATNGHALRTDALANKSGVGRRQLFQDPGGIPELMAEGLIKHSKRIGYYRPDALPPDIPSRKPKPA